MRTVSLNGEWKLYYFPQETYTSNCLDYDKKQAADVIACTVPGNVELDLSAAGILPKDLYAGMNITQGYPYEKYEWWYERTFQKPDFDGKISILFAGVDCLAEYWLNGEKIGQSENMFIGHEFDITDKLQADNILQVRLRSVMLETERYDVPVYTATTWSSHPESVNIRKAPHMFGWDIMPRAISAGLWRDVSLVLHDEYEISELFCQVLSLGNNHAGLLFSYHANKITENTVVEISGVCGDSTFSRKEKAYYRVGISYIDVVNPKLWNVRNYGEQNIYEITATLSDRGNVLCTKTMKFGIRTAELIRTDETDGKNGTFKFRINGQDILCLGTNWVPLDAYHSRDKARLPKALELLKDSGCNMVRCWGGGVYEDDEFFDFCDENGIMVWQDFAMACNAYPQDQAFGEKMFAEAESVVKHLRHHPSLVLWCGDNECDQLLYLCNSNPDDNVITRKTVYDAVRLHDKNRAYIPSSPYITEKTYNDRSYERLPEDHLWGPRDYFKSDYYKTSKAHFISEIGYHGCPEISSVEKFIDSEYLWPYSDNEQWNLHSSDQRNHPDRVLLMERQIQQLFAVKPASLEEFVTASQISQAEAVKFFVEQTRIQYPIKTGIIWWNLLDGWPQMSDAVVDYYYQKKLAYFYLRNIQKPLLLLMDEINNWNVDLYAVNNSNTNYRFQYTVCDIDNTADVIVKGETVIGPGERILLEHIPVMYSEQKMFLILWETGEKKYANHYMSGMPPISLRKYVEKLNKLKKYYLFE